MRRLRDEHRSRILSHLLSQTLNSSSPLSQNFITKSSPLLDSTTIYYTTAHLKTSSNRNLKYFKMKRQIKRFCASSIISNSNFDDNRPNADIHIAEISFRGLLVSGANISVFGKFSKLLFCPVLQSSFSSIHRLR